MSAVVPTDDHDPPEAGAAADPATVEAVFAQHHLGMLRLAVLLVDDRATAEDVVQDAFAGLHARWPGLVEPARAAAYLRVSVVNGCRSTLRRRRTARAWVPPHQAPAASAEESAVLSEERREVLAAVRALPPRQREVLVLRYWVHLSEAQIADELGLSRGTVKSTASRALDALEEALRAPEESR